MMLVFVVILMVCAFTRGQLSTSSEQDQNGTSTVLPPLPLSSVQFFTTNSNSSNTHINFHMTSQANSSQDDAVGELSTSISNSTMQATDATEAADSDPSTLWQYQHGVAILLYGSPILMIMATVGNFMSVVILQHPMFRKSSTSFILSALAFVDVVILYVGLMRQ